MANSYNSIYFSNLSAISARVACGGLMALTDATLTGRVRNGFAIIRPPGHHAEHDQAMYESWGRLPTKRKHATNSPNRIARAVCRRSGASACSTTWQSPRATRSGSTASSAS